MHCLVSIVQQQWYLKCEGAALPGFAFGNAAAHQFDQLPRYRKAKPVPPYRLVVLLSPEWLEEARHLFSVIPIPVSLTENRTVTLVSESTTFQRNNDFTLIRKFSRVSGEIE